MTANSPLPYTRPIFAERYTTMYIIGRRRGAIQRNAKPNFAPALAYVPMADGSSSAAPVMMPVPTVRKRPGLCFVLPTAAPVVGRLASVLCNMEWTPALTDAHLIHVR